jgi:hypothetical protein
LVEHDLAKVGVAGSSPVFRSKIILTLICWDFFSLPDSLLENVYSGGGTGRHAGLKILFAAMQVWVQLPSRVQNNSKTHDLRGFCFLAAKSSLLFTTLPLFIISYLVILFLRLKFTG